MSKSSYALTEHLHVPSWGSALCLDHRGNSHRDQFLKATSKPVLTCVLCWIPFSKRCLIISLRASNEMLFRYTQRLNTFFVKYNTCEEKCQVYLVLPTFSRPMFFLFFCLLYVHFFGFHYSALHGHAIQRAHKFFLPPILLLSNLISVLLDYISSAEQ